MSIDKQEQIWYNLIVPRENKNKKKERTIMKLTKALKEKVRQELEKQKTCLEEQDRKEYDNNRKKAKEELETYFTNIVAPAVAEILKKYNMDNNNEKVYGRGGFSLIRIDDYHITNEKIRKELLNKGEERRKAVEQAMMDFEIECELGVGKDQFLQAVEALCKKFIQENK